MSMVFNQKLNEMRFIVPNSEALIVAQHIGIADRTVGSYYMSERYDLCQEFFNDFTGEYYLDVIRCYTNVKAILSKIEALDMKNLFKYNLVPQNATISFLENSKDVDSLYKIDAPFTNEKKKYLKLNTEDVFLNLIRELIIGDLVDLVFRKIGSDGFLVYIEETDNFSSKIMSIHKKCIGL